MFTLRPVASGRPAFPPERIAWLGTSRLDFFRFWTHSSGGHTASVVLSRTVTEPGSGRKCVRLEER